MGLEKEFKIYYLPLKQNNHSQDPEFKRAAAETNRGPLVEFYHARVNPPSTFEVLDRVMKRLGVLPKYWGQHAVLPEPDLITEIISTIKIATIISFDGREITIDPVSFHGLSSGIFSLPGRPSKAEIKRSAKRTKRS